MNIRTIIVVLLAVICGLSAAWGMNQLGRSREVTVETETAPLVVARMDIARGQMVDSDHLTIKQWPKDMLPEGALSTIEEATERATSGAIMIGEPVLDGKLAAKGTGGGLAVLIPSGMRAYTIHTSQIASSVAGLVLPGNVVDVMLNLGSDRRTQGEDNKSSTTLLQAVEILAVNQDLEPPAESRTDPRDLASVTLLVSPDQVALLDLAQSMGQLTLSLRNPEDKETADTQPALLADILMRQYGPVVVEEEAEVEVESTEASGTELVELDDEKAEPEVFRIRTLRGADEGEVRVVSYENIVETQAP